MNRCHAFLWTVTCVVLWLGGRYGVDGAQILAMMPIAARSHWNVVDAVLQTLVARGHNVTAVTPFPKDKSVANYTQVDMSRLIPSGVSLPWDKIMGECSDQNNLPYLSGRHRLACKTIFEHDEFWHVIHSNKQVFSRFGSFSVFHIIFVFIYSTIITINT